MVDAPVKNQADNAKKFHNLIFIGASIIFCLVVIVAAILAGYFLIPSNVHYHISEQYQFFTQDKETSVYLGVMVPKSGPYQIVENVEIAWSGEYVIEEHAFIDVFKLTGEIKNSEIYEAMITYDVTLPQAEVSWLGSVDEADIRSQKGIECDNQIIMAQASKITDGFSENDAFRIFEYTSDHLSYSAIDKNLTSSSALQAYQLGNCACAGFTRLMVALCRAAGIPAKFVVGSVLPQLELYGSTQRFVSGYPGEAHAWVEYFSEGQWSLADPTQGSGQPNTFKRNDGRHLLYGEYGQLWEAYQDMYAWAANHGQIIEIKEDSFKSVFAAAPDAFVSSVIIVRKGWDGRWLNALLVWGLTTVVLCKIRNMLFFPS